MAGHDVWFREVQGGQRRIGRIVGYYYDMAQLVIECSFAPLYSVDPQMYHIQLTAGFRPGYLQYTCVDVFLVDETARGKDSKYPHFCPRCQAPAFVLFRTVECTALGCYNYHRPQ